MKMAYLTSPLGTVLVTGNQSGVQNISITDTPCTETVVPDDLKDVVLQLREYFEGKRKRFDLKLIPDGTEFQKKVWKALMEIPYGRTISYLELAEKLGNPNAVRAVAAANGKNPLWIVVPCHRVIGRDGSLTGYAGGIQRKKWLLEHEQSSVQQILNF